MTITVHHLNRSRSKRVLWLLEELEMPYDLVKHQRDSQTGLAPATLKAVHPLGKAPIMVDGDITICESGAVIEYILNQDVQQRLRPTFGSLAYYRYLEWLHFAEGSLGLPVITRLLMNREARDGQQPLDAYIAKEIAVDFGYIETALTEHPYFSGETFSAADIMMTISLEIAGNVGCLEGRSSTLAYLETMQARPAYQRAAAQG